ncbi:MAG: DUF2480 family protein [Flavobacteriaceae bacterium]
MQEETDPIVNRVAQSKLVTFDLEDYYPVGERHVLDIKDWLFEGLILREKEFRAHVESHTWQQYQGAYVALNCSTDAIIPAWAYMLISTKLQPYAKLVVIGDLEQLESTIYLKVLTDIDLDQFKDKPVIIKGCSEKPVPGNAYLWAASIIQQVAKSVMYGEACSSVPLFKRK